MNTVNAERTITLLEEMIDDMNRQMERIFVDLNKPADMPMDTFVAFIELKSCLSRDIDSLKEQIEAE
jgi:hypothetical protein